MASTKDKKVISKPSIKKEVVDKIDTVKTVLDPDDFRNLETLSRDVENSKLLMALEEQSLLNMQLNLKLLSHNIERQKQILTAKAQEFELIKQRHTNFKKEIWPKYGLKENEGLGYNPSTGELVK